MGYDTLELILENNGAILFNFAVENITIQILFR